jgi:hypothetical protein
VRCGRRGRRWNRLRSPTEHCFPFEGCLGRRRQLRWRDDLRHRCDQRWSYGGCGHLWGWGHLRYCRGGCWLGSRPDRCVGGGYHKSCSVLLVHDQGGQYADDGHGDRQKDQQEFIRTCPKKMHLTPPVRPPQKLTRYTRKSNQMRLSEMLLSPALYANSRNPLLETGAAQLRWNASTPLRSAAPTRTFQGKLSLSRRQPRGTYRMNERSRQTAPVAPQGTTLGLPHETAHETVHETVHVYRLRA